MPQATSTALLAKTNKSGNKNEVEEYMDVSRSRSNSFKVPTE